MSIAAFSPTEEDVNAYESLKAELLGQLRKGQVRDQTCRGHVGLINQGATCYLNSLVQALFHIPAFKKFVLQVESTANVISALRFLFARLQLSEDCAVSTKALTSAFGWSNADVFEQHDAQELFVSMADAMSQECSDLDDFFTKNFKGTMTDELECPKCGHRNNNTSSFQDLPLNLPQTDSKDGLVFSDLLGAVIASETLDDQNLWTCGGCSVPVAAKKTVTYNTLPPVLFAHLKRTGYDQVAQRRTKISTPVYFPTEFVGSALKPDDTNTYKLKSILLHTGTAHGGHYKALVQSKGVWYEYDDSTVTELSKDEESKLFWYHTPSDAEGRLGSSVYESAYMLIYQLDDSATSALETEEITVPADLSEQVAIANAKLQKLKKAYEVHKMMTEVTSFKISADVGSHVKACNIAPVPSVNFLLSSCSLQKTLEVVHASFVNNGILDSGTDLSHCRLRRYNAASRMVGETFDGRAELSLMDLGLFPLCSLALEVVAPGDSFADFNPKEVEVRVVEWKEGSKDIDATAQDVFVLISGEESASIGALRKAMAGHFSVDEHRVVMLNTPPQSSSHYVELEHDVTLLSDAFVTSGDDIIVHLLPEGETRDGKGEGIISKIILEKRSVVIMFNVPSSGGDDDAEVAYDKSLGVLLDATLGDLKDLIAAELKLSVGDFFVCRNSSAPQLKALNKTLDVLNFVDHSIIHVRLGQQLSFGEFNMCLEADTSVDEGNWMIVPEKKQVKLNDIAVKSGMSINQLKEKIFEEWGSLVSGTEGMTAPQSVHHLRLRDGQTGVQSGPLRGERIVSKCFLGLSDGRKIVVQVLAEPEIFGPDQLYITNRIISFQNKIVSRPIGMQVNKGCTVQELFKLLLEKFPELNEASGDPDDAAVEMYGDLHKEFPESRILAVAKAYNTGPPLSMKESLRLKWNDKTVVKDFTSAIDKLPFNIRDGTVLVLRGVADFERAREAARARVADRPGSSANLGGGDSPARGRVRPGSRSRSRSGSRGKEKGITINVDVEAPNLPNPDGTGTGTGAGIAAKSGNFDRKPMNLNDELHAELPNAPVRMVKVLRSPRPGEENA